MTKAELMGIYDTACRKKGQPQDMAEFNGWWKHLGMMDSRDVEEAMSEWWAQSNFMPIAKDLLSLSARRASARRAEASRETDLVRWRCPDCKATFCGFVPPEDMKGRRCRRPLGQGRICGARMHEEERDRARDLTQDHTPQEVA